MYQIIKPYIGKKILGLFLVIATTLISLLSPYIFKLIIDSAIMNRNLKLLFVYVLIFAGIFLAGRLLYFLQRYLFIYIGKKMLYHLRIDLYREVASKDILFFTKKNVGELMSRLLQEVPLITSFLTETLVNIITQIITFIIALFIMLSLSVEITLSVLCILPFVAITLYYFNPRLKKINQETMRRNVDIHDKLQENFSNIKAFHYSRLNGYGLRRLSTSFRNMIEVRFKSFRLNSIVSTLLATLYFLPSLFVLGFGGYKVIGGLMTLGTVLAIHQYISYLFSPLQSLTTINFNFQEFVPAFERYYDMFDYDKGKVVKEARLGRITTGISVKDLTFSYPNGKPIFDGFNVLIRPGAVVHLTGDNGSGKSTFIDLICGVIKPTAGEVLYDSIDVNLINPLCLREQLGVVPQTLYLFKDTVRNNILLGRKISDDEIIRISKELNFSEITSGSEINLDTYLAGGGSNLSGGQKQKIAILRALVHGPSLLILDEALTFLDDRAKQHFTQYLQKTAHTRITLFISHETIPHLAVTETISFENTKKPQLLMASQ